MPECEWCRAPNPQGGRVCEQCGGALPLGTPAERPALLSARDRERRGTVLGLGSPEQLAHPGGKTLLHNGSQALAQAENADGTQETSVAPLSRATQSGSPHAVRLPHLQPPPQGELPRATLAGVPEADSPVFTRLSLRRGTRVSAAGAAQEFSVRGLLPPVSAGAVQPAPRRLWRWDVPHVAGLLGCAALIGAAIAVVLPRPELVVADFHATATGSDRVKVRCKECPENAALRWGEQTAPLVAGLATIDSPHLLPVGPNHFELDLVLEDGKVISLPLNLSLAFRVKLDTVGIADWPPEARLTVQVPPEARVAVDGAPLQVQGGRALQVLRLEAEAQGQSAVPMEIKKDFVVTVYSGSQERSSTAQLRATVLPLTYELRQVPPARGRATAAAVAGEPPAAELRGQTRPKATVTLRPLEGDVPPISFKADGRGRIFRRLPPAFSGPARVEVSQSGFVLRWSLLTL